VLKSSHIIMLVDSLNNVFRIHSSWFRKWVKSPEGDL